MCFYINTTTASSSVLETDATFPEDSGHSQRSSPGDLSVALPPCFGIRTFVFCGGLFFSGLLCGVYKILIPLSERECTFSSAFLPYLQTNHCLRTTWDLLGLFEGLGQEDQGKLSWPLCGASSLLIWSPRKSAQKANLVGNY